MTIKITPAMLCDLCGGKFTYEACEAICEYFDECGCDFSPSIGDICISFGEIPATDIIDEEDEAIIYTLENGNVLIAY